MTTVVTASEQRNLADLVGRRVLSGDVSAAVALVGDRHGIRQTACAGRRSATNERAPSPAALFDLASLSKPFAATLALRLASTQALPLSLCLADVWENVARPMARVTLESLLRHRAGLIPWTPLWMRCGSRDEMTTLLLSGELLGAPRGTYSDLGYILWAKSVERLLGRTPGDLLRDVVLKPLGLTGAISTPPPDRRRVVECTLTSDRERELARDQGLPLRDRRRREGEVQDGNARWLGGFCGHAGLFGSATGVWGLAAEWLAPKLLDPALVSKALSGRGRLRLGWWARRMRGAAGSAMGRDAFGHTGFTGGSVWVDRETDRIFVLLAHRRNHTVDLDRWRRRFHTLAARSARGVVGR